MDFHGKTALVTGTARGIGYATAKKLIEGGVSKIALVDVNGERLRETAADLKREGTEIVTYEADVACEARVREVCADVLEKFGAVDILVNNAGIYSGAKPFVDQTSDDWRRKIDINVYGTLYFTHALLPKMLERHYGKIVNIGSVAGVYGLRNMVEYSLTKGAVIAFTVALAKEVTREGVNVNCVSPGSISDNPDSMPNHSFKGRAGSPEECANVICFLCSDEASYVAGQNYLCDGCRKLM